MEPLSDSEALFRFMIFFVSMLAFAAITIGGVRLGRHMSPAERITISPSGNSALLRRSLLSGAFLLLVFGVLVSAISIWIYRSIS